MNSEAVSETFVARFVGATALVWGGACAPVTVERLIEPRIGGLSAIAVTMTLRPAINAWDW